MEYWDTVDAGIVFRGSDVGSARSKSMLSPPYMYDILSPWDLLPEFYGKFISEVHVAYTSTYLSDLCMYGV